jgi:nitric oxide reductase large subunit
VKVQLNYRQQLTTFVVIAVGTWIAYLLVFQYFFPNDYDPINSRGVFWAWLIGTTLLLLVVMVALFRLLSTPPRWRPTMAIAGIAPALVLDCIATTFYSDWFASSGPYEPTAYSATILGGAGVMLLFAVRGSR